MGPADVVDLGIIQVPEGRQLFGPLTVAENLRLGFHRQAAQAHRQVPAALEGADGTLLTPSGLSAISVALLGVLKAGGSYSDAQIIDWLLTSCFEGLGAPARTPRRRGA